MNSRQSRLTIEDAEVAALQALAHIVSNDQLGARLLSLTGLDAETLRERAGTREVLAATMDFLAANEADLVACAEAIGRRPEDLALAHAALSA